MWTRQVATEEQARKEMAEHEARGKKVYGPYKVKAPNGRDDVWQFGVSL